MRVALAVLVVAALAFIGFRAGTRVLDRQQVDTATTATPQLVADAWATATAAGDLAALDDLAADRVDDELLRATHDEVLPVLGQGVEVTVETVEQDDNSAIATLAWSATPGASDGSWTWTSELELIRARGSWSADWDTTAVHPSLRPGWRLAVTELEAARAPVLDRLGRTLSRAGAAVEIGVQPGRLPDEMRVLSTVASVLPEAYDPLVELLERDDLEDDWYYPLVTVSSTRADEAWVELVALSGLLRRDAEAGVGAAVSAPEVVGAVALVDGVRQGISGLEEAFDDRLTGSATTEVTLLSPEGGVRDTLFTFQSDPAPPLVTTLDRDVQQAVDDAVIAVDDPVGVVVIDPSTAGVLAVASRPTTGYARALEGRYPPGIIAGLVPVAAAVGAGADLDATIPCPADAVVGGVRVTSRTAAPDDPTSLDLLTGGCDVAAARLGVDVGDAALVEAAAALGLTTEIELSVPARGWSWPGTVTDAGTASAAVGHGPVEASALGVASLAATVARGAPATPVVLADDVDSAPTPLAPDVVAGLRSVLRRAGESGEVTVPGARVAGATARTGAVSGDPAPPTGWWFGFIEGDGPDVAIAVVVERDDGTRAAAIAQRVVRELVG